MAAEGFGRATNYGWDDLFEHCLFIQHGHDFFCHLNLEGLIENQEYESSGTQVLSYVVIVTKS